MTSPDGVTWTARTSGTTTRLMKVAAGPSAIVAVGLEGVVVKSTDGVSWTTHSVGLSGSAGNLYGVAADGAGFVATGAAGLVAHSPDGATWATREWLTPRDLLGIAVGSTTTVAVGASGVIFSRD